MNLYFRKILQSAAGRALFGICIFYLLVSGKTYGQSPAYNFGWDVGKRQLITSAALWSGIQIYDMMRQAEVIDEFEDIDPAQLWNFDRKIVEYQHSTSASNWSHRTLYASVAAPIILTLVDSKMNTESNSIFWMGLQGYFLESGITQLVKILSERPRPSIYQKGTDMLHTPLSKNATKSFFSGHASTSAYFAFFAARVYVDLHPDSRIKPVIWGLASALSGTTGYLRTRAGKHFYTDIVAGWIYGASLGLVIPALHRSKRFNMTFYGRGVHMSYLF